MKFYAVAASMILSALLSSAVFAGESTSWRKEKTAGINGTTIEGYSLHTSGGLCQIYILPDRTVMGSGVDYNWHNKKVTDHIDIRTEGGQAVLKRHIDHHDVTANPSRLSAREKYYVFDAKCGPQIKLLPPKVKEKFQVWFRIE